MKRRSTPLYRARSAPRSPNPSPLHHSLRSFAFAYTIDHLLRVAPTPQSLSSYIGRVSAVIAKLVMDVLLCVFPGKVRKAATAGVVSLAHHSSVVLHREVLKAIQNKVRCSVTSPTQPDLTDLLTISPSCVPSCKRSSAPFQKKDRCQTSGCLREGGSSRSAGYGAAPATTHLESHTNTRTNKRPALSG